MGSTALEYGHNYATMSFVYQCPASKVYGANIGPTWGREDPGGPHVGSVNFVIWVLMPSHWRQASMQRRSLFQHLIFPLRTNYKRVWKQWSFCQVIFEIFSPCDIIVYWTFDITKRYHSQCLPHILYIAWCSPYTWWRHQMEIFSASLALCAGNSPITGEFTPQRPVTRNFDVFFDLRLDKVHNRGAHDLRHHRAHYDIIVMTHG